MNAISVSAICTFGLSLEDDIAFWRRHGITNVGVSIAKIEREGWSKGVDLVRCAQRDAGLQVGNLIGLGPFHLADRAQWTTQRERLLRSLDAAEGFDAGCIVVTTGPAGPLCWEDAADALYEAMEPVIDEARRRGIVIALEHTNSLRVDVGFIHTLRDAIDLARRLELGVCMEINACWAERDLASTVKNGIDVIELVQVSDFAVGTLSTPNRLVPGDGDIPLDRILTNVIAAGYAGAFDLELIGPRIDDEGYEIAVPRAIAALSEMLDEIKPT